MSNIASYDPDTGRVTHWCPDGYADPPEPNIAVGDAEWASRMYDPSSWYVVDGVLGYYPPPPQPPPHRALEMLETGMQLESKTAPHLNGTYSCAVGSVSIEAGILTAISAGINLPNGVAVVFDTSNNPHEFTPDQFRDYYRVKLAFCQALNIVRQTNTGELPAQPVAIP